MKKILVISGKGGTGKTFVTASLACLAGDNKIMVDCDVDAANLHILLHPVIQKTEVFKGGHKAEILNETCIICGKCLTICRFEAIRTIKTNNAVEKIFLDPLSCEGCGACVHGCPVGAIVLHEQENGKWFVSDTKYGPLVYAKLGIAAENSGRLVSKIKEEALKIGRNLEADYMIIDGPPGIGCPVISSMSGVDLALVVTEPTLSGIHDMQRVIQVARHFQVEVKVVINKFDLNIDNTADIEKMCADDNIEIVGRIPFFINVAKSIVHTVPYSEFAEDIVSRELRVIWNKIS